MKKILLIFIYIFLYSFLFSTSAYLVDFEKYGFFENLGKDDYKYNITNLLGLKLCFSSGIYPNVLYLDNYSKKEELSNDVFGYKDKIDINFIFNNEEDYPIKQFYLSQMFEKLGLLEVAIKSYYSIIVFFPKSILYKYSDIYSRGFVYLAEEAIDRIIDIIDKNPKLNISFDNFVFEIDNKFDNDTKNDKFYIDPGEIKYKNNKKNFFTIQKNIDRRKDLDSAVYHKDNISLKNIRIASYSNMFIYNKFIREKENKIFSKICFDIKKFNINILMFDFMQFSDKFFKKIYFKKKISIIFNIYVDLKYYLNNKEKNQSVLCEQIKSLADKEYLFGWNIVFYDNFDDTGKDNFLLKEEILKFIKNLDNKHPIILTNEALKDLNLFFIIEKYIDIVNIKTNDQIFYLNYTFLKDLNFFIKKPIFIQNNISQQKYDIFNFYKKLKNFFRENDFYSFKKNLGYVLNFTN